MKKIILTMVLTMVLSVITACGNSSTSGDSSDGEEMNVVKIGTLHPLSGGLALEGQQMRDAIRLAVMEANEAGGIKSLGGAEIQLIETDHEGSAEKGVSEVQNLDRAGVAGIIGTYSSGVALPATQEAERLNIPFVIDIGSVDALTERGFKFTFRLQPPATLMAKNFLFYLNELNKTVDEPLKTAVIIHEDSVFGSSIAGLIEQQAEEFGVEVLVSLAHSASTADLSSAVNRVNDLKPDMVLMTTYLRDGTLMVEGLNNSNYQPRAIIGIANGAFSNAQFMEEQSSINEYIMDVNYTINPKSDLAQDVRERFLEEFDKNLGPNAAYSYMSAKVLIDAIERAGSTDRDAIREALSETSYSEHILPQDAIEFDETGQNINAQAVLNQIFDGKSKVVYPELFQETTPVYPAW